VGLPPFYYILDYLGVQNGWKYFPRYPVKKLQKLKKGKTAVIFMHPSNAFELEKSVKKVTFQDFKHFLRIRLRYQIVDSLIKGESARLYFYNLLPKPLRQLLRNWLFEKTQEV